MNPEKKSADLDQLKQLLAKSYEGGEANDVPPLPEGLRDRIADQYGQSATTPSPKAVTQKVGFFSAVSQLFATPSLQAVAALVILLLVATVVIKNNGPSSTGGTLRGGDGTLSSVTCILMDLDEAEKAAVAESGLAEDALTTADSPDALTKALEAVGVRIVIDGKTDQILGYLPGSNTPTIEEPLPADPAALTSKIAQIIAELSK
jgi:hypothetical protein